ncbi:MAG: hypothetical protein ACPF98_09250 [Prochlorococcaceae cyanobacterium]
MTPFLEVRRLWHRYASSDWTLQDIDFSLEAGQLLGLLALLFTGFAVMPVGRENQNHQRHQQQGQPSHLGRQKHENIKES